MRKHAFYFSILLLEELTYSDLNESCPDATSIVVTVLAGGRLGNQVWEYLSVWAVARNHPGWWPAVPRTILNTLQHLFSPLAIPAIEDLAERCNAPFLLEELKHCADRGNQDLLQESSEESLHAIGDRIRKAQKLKDDEPLEFVGVHVRRRDYFLFLWYTFSDAKVANQQFYLNAMEEMRRQLHPRHCAFVVVSDDLAWCRKYLTGAPDVEIAGTGDTKNPYFDLALLSACNHTVFAYGTYGLTAAMQNPLGNTIVYARGGSRNAIVLLAKMRNWTLV
ncbi:hypothetical protein B566_EDAN012585 [Ephemera danica]|nr:hypothetical protein B566_EDAN012585 [Ephemera danica]